MFQKGIFQSSINTNTTRTSSQSGLRMYLWKRALSLLTVREQAVSVRRISRFFRECSDEYMKQFWSGKPIVYVPQDTSSLARALVLCQRLTEQVEYMEASTVVLVLAEGVHKSVGSWRSPYGATYQQTMSVLCNNLSVVGKGQKETTVLGGLVVEKGRYLRVTNLTVKNPCGPGLYADGRQGTKLELNSVTTGECGSNGVVVHSGARLVATECQFHRNGCFGVSVHTSSARLTSCTSHHNKKSGVWAYGRSTQGVITPYSCRQGGVPLRWVKIGVSRNF